MRRERPLWGPQGAQAVRRAFEMPIVVGRSLILSKMAGSSSEPTGPLSTLTASDHAHFTRVADQQPDPDRHGRPEAREPRPGPKAPKFCTNGKP